MAPAYTGDIDVSNINAGLSDMHAFRSAPYLRIAVATAMLAAALAGPAAAYPNCDKYPFGSDEWWFCISDNRGER